MKSNVEIKQMVEELLNERLKDQGYDVVDLVSIPKSNNRMVQMRTLGDVLADFESSDQENGMSYVIHIKAKGPERERSDANVTADSIDGPLKPENVYLGDGSLNISYLEKNAQVLLQSGETALAKNIYRTIQQSGRGAAVALKGIGQCEEAEGRYDQAQKHYEESIAYVPSISVYQKLIGVLIKAKREEYAAEVIERALHLKDISDRDRFELHKASGNCWSRVDKSDRAQQAYQRALQIDPGADDIQANLGSLYLKNDQIEAAMRCFQDACAANPSNDSAWMGLANCYLQRGDRNKAHDCLAKVLEIDINNPKAVFHIVKCAYELNRYETAETLLTRYVDVGPVNINLLYSLAGLRYHLAKYSPAEEIIRRILKIKPDHTGAKQIQSLIEKKRTN